MKSCLWFKVRTWGWKEKDSYNVAHIDFSGCIMGQKRRHFEDYLESEVTSFQRRLQITSTSTSLFNLGKAIEERDVCQLCQPS